jgi:hypothetical protein
MQGIGLEEDNSKEKDIIKHNPTLTKSLEGLPCKYPSMCVGAGALHEHHPLVSLGVEQGDCKHAVGHRQAKERSDLRHREPTLKGLTTTLNLHYVWCGPTDVICAARTLPLNATGFVRMKPWGFGKSPTLLDHFKLTDFHFLEKKPINISGAPSLPIFIRTLSNAIICNSKSFISQRCVQKYSSALSRLAVICTG